MRLLRVTFRCFGPFEDQTLDLSSSDCLQVVFGANESGKSSALRGLNALMFGFPGQSPDDFRFKYNQFRVQALIESRAGRQLECVRRKGNKDTLRKSCDKEVLPEHHLTEMLGGLDRAQFEMLFGLDAARLVEGGQSITKGKGELGEALFAAGAGMKGLRILAQTLEERQSQLFLPSGKNQKIAEALRQHQEAKDSVRGLMLSPEKYAEAEAAAQRSADEVSRLAEERKQARLRHNLLQRYKSALPTMGLLKAARERLAPVADAPILSAGFDSKLENARQIHSLASSELSGLEEERKRLADQLQVDPSLDAILKESSEVDELARQVGAALKLREEEVRAATFSIDERGKARDIYRELTGSTDWGQMDDLKPRLDQRGQIQKLANDRSAIVRDVQQAEAGVLEAERQLIEARAELSAMPSPSDPAAWQALVDEIASLGPLEKQQEQLGQELQKEERRLHQEFARFQPTSSIPWADAPSLPVPLPAAVERFRAELDALQSRLARLSDEQANTKRSLEALWVSSADQVGSEPVPTLEELTEARQDRGRGLQGVRMRLAGQPDLQLELDLCNRHAPGRPLMDAVESSVLHCDHLADRLRREAGRVAAYHSLKQQEAVLKGRLEEMEAEASRARSEVSSLEERWRAAWQPAGISPDTPKVMEKWLADWSAFLVRVTAWTEGRRRHEVDHGRIESLRRKLGEGCLPASTAETLSEGLAAARKAISEAKALRDRRATLERDVRRMEKQSEEARQRLEQARKLRDEWDRSWMEAVSALRLQDRHPTVEVAQSYLARIDQMQQHLRDMRIKDARVREIQADRALLMDRMSRVRQRLDPAARPTTSESLEADFRALEAALVQAREARARQQEVSRQLRSLDQKIESSRANQREAVATLQALAAEAGCSIEELPGAVQRARQRAQESGLVQDYEEALAQQAQGEQVERFSSAAQAAAADLDQQLAELEGRINQLDHAVSQAEARSREAVQVLEGYRQASSAAADAKQQAVSLTARLEELVKEYAAIQLARAAIEKAKDRYRARYQDTMLGRASAYFRTLTNKAFSGIEIDNEEGMDVVKAVRSRASRPDGRVPVEGLSDGTRDQLFLALRLAGIEHHLKDREPVPLIIDDVLINFDDHRARSTLQCLAELALQTQVVVFTHHQHVVDLACAVCPDTSVLRLQRGSEEAA
jgi:uncharacterized protein YhaN